MSSLKGKKILLGVCGSIAAYKSAFLIRLLVKEGAKVKVIMTREAGKFISPLSLSTLSKNPVLSELTTADDSRWNNHVELALWADLFLIAPASANTIAKFANGYCDNLLTAVYLSARCPVFISPAMDEDMWAHASTKRNIQLLNQNGNTVLKVSHGELASGLIGEGRMMQPEEIISLLTNYFNSSQSLKGKKILITAGPTYEAIDPVRFIGNHSSGKMGYALAEVCIKHGADVTLISGPVNISVPSHLKKFVSIKTADELFSATTKAFVIADITIMAAAVADYKPQKTAVNKIKKKEGELNIELVKTKDILLEIGKKKKKNQLLIGFALETENELANAKEKLKTKNLDFIILNSLKDKGAGFGTDTNKVTVIDSGGKKKELPMKMKTEIAHDIVNIIISKLHA
ncbi:phosphopantothenoylcysteine decarboxylase [Bacteroidota bacterium]|nr:phosphopantothenoylcysteine decarboxylase [Bacteroidota bacterium]